MNVLKDNGHGVTQKSLEFWHKNKALIGPVLSVEVRDNLLTDMHPNGYPVEYPCLITGADGAIYLSGCTCGYGGEGPNGTAKILADIGVPLERARKMMTEGVICYHTPERRLI
jgi:hypothetical protein